MAPINAFLRVVLTSAPAVGLASCTDLIPKFVPSVKAEENIGAAYPFESRCVTVKGSKMHCVEAGSGGTPMVLLHGTRTRCRGSR